MGQQSGSEGGFTLLELLAVIVSVGILIALGVIMLTSN
jgi:prepilin-type N-terminal cleavage/methylation domain-containing protein